MSGRPVRIGVQYLPQHSATYGPIRDAVLSFIRGQAQSVQIQVKPPEPIGMAQMQSVPPSPAELQRMLGVTATAR